MTPEEKFIVDLDGYLVFKDVLSADEVAEMNEIIDKGQRQGRPSLVDEIYPLIERTVDDSRDLFSGCTFRKIHCSKTKRRHFESRLSQSTIFHGASSMMRSKISWRAAWMVSLGSL